MSKILDEDDWLNYQDMWTILKFNKQGEKLNMLKESRYKTARLVVYHQPTYYNMKTILISALNLDWWLHSV